MSILCLIKGGLISVSLAFSQTPFYTARPDHAYRTSVSRGVHVYTPAFDGTQCV